MVFRGQTSCQACGRNLSDRTPPTEARPTAPTPAQATPADSTPETSDAPAATDPVRLFESSRMPAPTPLHAAVSLNDMMAPSATGAPADRIVTPADAPSGNAVLPELSPWDGPVAGATPGPQPNPVSGRPSPPPRPGGAWVPQGQMRQAPPAGRQWRSDPYAGRSTNWGLWVAIAIVAIAVAAVVNSVNFNLNGPFNQNGLYPLGTADFNNPPIATAIPEQTFVPMAFPSVDPLVAVGGLHEGRTDQTATRLPDGRVVVVGGLVLRPGANSALSSIETYDPMTRSFASTGSLTTARYDHTATDIGNGILLIAGGRDTHGSPLGSAELYDSRSGVTVVTGAMSKPRSSAAAVLLDDGRVLIVGGDNGAGALSSAEIYDPKTARFSRTGSLADGPVTATKMTDGRVLIAGGTDQFGPVSAAIVYDPRDDSFSVITEMGTARWGATSCLLADGRVLVVGGIGQGKQVNATAETYDPATKMFESVALADRRASSTTTALADGSVLMVGGQDDYGSAIATVERYYPGTGSSTPIGTMAEARMGHTATLLADGSVLIVGGVGPEGSVLADAGRYVSGTGPAGSPSGSLLPSESPAVSPAAGGPSPSPLAVSDATRGIAGRSASRSAGSIRRS